MASDIPEWVCRQCLQRRHDGTILASRRAEYERLRVPAILRPLWMEWNEPTDLLGSSAQRRRPAEVALEIGGWRATLRDWQRLMHATTHARRGNSSH